MCVVINAELMIVQIILFVNTLSFQMQDSGFLLCKPWLRESDTKGKAVAFILIAGGLSQLVLGLSMGFIISVFGTTRVVLVVALIGECFATISALFLTTKPASRGCQWCSWKPLVKCFQCLIHHEAQDEHESLELLDQT